MGAGQGPRVLPEERDRAILAGCASSVAGACFLIGAALQHGWVTGLFVIAGLAQLALAGAHLAAGRSEG